MQRSADALIMAAGKGERFGKRKQFMDFNGTTMLNHVVGLFEKNMYIHNIIIVYPDDMTESKARDESRITAAVKFVSGGAERADSVRNGLEEVNSEYVLIHDSVRPLCSKKLIKNVLESTFKLEAVVPGINPSSTVKYKQNEVFRTIDRNSLFLIQTPQGYRTRIIKEAYLKTDKSIYTDSSSIVEENGVDVTVIPGERTNIKITYEDDYKYAVNILGDKL